MKTNSLIILISSIVLLLLGVALNAFLLYILSTLEETSRELDRRLAEQEDGGPHLTQTEKIIEEFRIRENAINRHFVDAGSVVDFLSLLEKTGRDAGASVKILNVKEDPTAPLELTLLVEGSFGSVMKTIRAYEYLSIPLSSSRGGLSVSNVSDKGEATWSASLIYTLPQSL
jgi:hypothetical protein